MPGVTYERAVQFTNHGPVALHIVRGPKPTGLYELRPVLSNDAIQGLERVTAMQKRLSAEATMVGINGDFYNFDSGRPSGVLMRDGVVDSPPYGDRSSVGVSAEGVVDVRRIQFFGTWKGLGQRRAVNDMNQLPGANGISLFTPSYGRGDAAAVRRGHRGAVAVPARDTEHGSRRRRDRDRKRRRDADPRRRCGARGARHRRAEARRRGADRHERRAPAHLPSAVGRDHAGDRRRTGDRPQQQARLPRPRGVRAEPARPAQPAHRSRPARQRPRDHGRHGRSPPRLQRRDDELRARADPRPARRGHRLRVRRRRLDHRRVRGRAAEPALRPERRARGLHLAPAHVLRHGRAARAGRRLAQRRRDRRDAAARPTRSCARRP